MRRDRVHAQRLLSIVLLASATLAGSSATAAAKPPEVPTLGEDTVTVTGSNFGTDPLSAINVRIDASSGPSGEDPSGDAAFGLNLALPVSISSPVSCLNVTGNTAVMTLSGPFPNGPAGLIAVIVRVVDNGGSGRDRFEYYPVLPEIGFLPDCVTGAPGYFGGPLDGRAQVFDAPPAPASKSQCLHGGFAGFGFRNQGQCIKFVSSTTPDGR